MARPRVVETIKPLQPIAIVPMGIMAIREMLRHIIRRLEQILLAREAERFEAALAPWRALDLEREDSRGEESNLGLARNDHCARADFLTGRQ